jgi:hypothetical protein
MQLVSTTGMNKITRISCSYLHLQLLPRVHLKAKNFNTRVYAREVGFVENFFWQDELLNIRLTYPQYSFFIVH